MVAMTAEISLTFIKLMEEESASLDVGVRKTSKTGDRGTESITMVSATPLEVGGSIHTGRS